MSNSFDIICIAGADLSSPFWTNRQQIMSRVAKKHRVLYVEPRRFFLRHLVSILKNPRRFFGVSRVNDNLLVHAQINFLPGSRSLQLINKFNHSFNQWLIGRIQKQHNFINPILWIYDTSANLYLGKLGERFVLYDCVDEHKAQAGIDKHSALAEEEESQILAKANLVTCTSKNLFREKLAKNKNTHLVSNVGDYASFNPAALSKLDIPEDIANIKKPILGSVGAIDAYKIDLDLVYKTAKNNPQWSFVFIGQEKHADKSTDTSRLRSLANIHFLGPRNREEVPAYVKAFDACLIPYVNNEYNKFSLPLKFFEFMATGKPIVATGLPELKKYEALISISENESGKLTSAINTALRSGQEGRKERIRIASQNSWGSRTQKLLDFLNQSPS